MSQQDYVVKINQSVDLYLKVYCTQFENCQWVSASEALTWPTLQQAQDVASLIGNGTVGTTKPRN